MRALLIIDYYRFCSLKSSKLHCVKNSKPNYESILSALFTIHKNHINISAFWTQKTTEELEGSNLNFPDSPKLS